MNLSFILDVTLGLIFIYLTLSLLASEIQELIATLFQWRAQHLRRAIEILLAGDLQNSQDLRVIQLVNQIYANPLVKSLNQEAKGFLPVLPRRFTWGIASAYRSLKALKTPTPGLQAQDTVFGDQKRSGPSYIPAQTFANSLIDTLQVPTLVQKLSESRFAKFKEQKLAEIQNILFQMQEQSADDENMANFFNKMYQEFAEMHADFEQILWNFQQDKADLVTSINRMAESLDRYIDSFQADMITNEISTKALRRLQFLKEDAFGDPEKAISLGGLQPNVNEVVQSVDRNSPVYQEIKESMQDKDDDRFQAIEDVIDRLPPSMAQNLTILAKNAQTKVQKTEEGISLLRHEIENSFNSSMDRASGVYKRNAKGVAILLGIIIATGSNADAFHMVNRLSKDSTIRNTIVNNAGEVLRQNNQYAQSFQALRTETDNALTNIALPLGWSDANLQQQLQQQQTPTLSTANLQESTSSQPQSFPLFKYLGMFFGWVISGIAIAMGAPFWFDLLNKIVNVRNSGKSPTR
ncbi:MAG: hypothetical protein QNJ36_02555 [Calothrix sp. MO_167.B42]|nr:hypothetical protein [Calothrix sp. MO_167.B42]